ncbi:MAG: S8 family serine peptidase, partial [Phycisphaerae bacterium]|nr:S8 family serine peptidase [Phycisphaerae bacterium]
MAGSMVLWAAAGAIACGSIALASVPRAVNALPGEFAERAMVRARPGVVNLKAGDVSWRQRPSALGATEFRPGARHVLVLDGPADERRRRALASVGVRPGEYLPTHALIADLSRTTPEAVRATGVVLWAGEFADSWKMNGSIGRRAWIDPEREAMRRSGTVALNVVLFEGADADLAVAGIAAVPGVTILHVERSGGDVAVGVFSEIGRLGQIAAIHEVGWVEEKPEFVPRGYASRWILQRNKKDAFPLYDAGLRGQGQVIGIIDGWVSVTHCSFVDPLVPIFEPGLYPDHRKILAYNADWIGYNLHGTHVSGIAVGDAGDDSADTRGVAYESRMVFNTWPGFTEESVFERLALHASQGAAIHSNSWGSPDSTEYDFAARAVDNFSYLNPDNLVLYAVSNGETILNPENAKNCLAVTSSGTEGNQDAMCNTTGDPTDKPGRGPTTDGRRKPEIAAPGCSIYSSSGQSCSTRALDGTSMAAPAVAGIAALMRQYFVEGYYPRGQADTHRGFIPSGALLKASILNAGIDLTGEPGYPNDYEGWGRLQADSTLYFPGDARRLIVRDIRPDHPWALATGGAFRFFVRVESSGEPLRVTLAFHDAPAALQASYAPVNDLDLAVVSPSGVVYSGNYFADGRSIAGESWDPLNNVEQVFISDPESGVWMVRVIAREVNVGPSQSYAVVATGAIVEGCPADFDQSGFVDTDDFDRFMEAFFDGSPLSDFDGDGWVDFDDYVG